jgi:hypothetical protein
MATIAKALPIRRELAQRSMSRPIGQAVGDLMVRVGAALDPREFWRAFRNAVEQSDGDWAGSTRHFR